MARALSLIEPKEELSQIHDFFNGEKDSNLCRHLQRHGFYWPMMAKDAIEI